MATTGEQTRKRILVTATDLFGRRGFEKVSMKEIAGRLGISEPAVYRYFQSKEELENAVLDGLVAQVEVDGLFKRLAEVESVEPLLRGLAEHIVGLFSKRQNLYRLLLFSSLGGHSRAHAVYARIRGDYCSFLVAQLDRLYARGRIRRVNNEVTARCFVGMVFDCALSFGLWKGMQGRVFPPARVIANNVGIYARGLEATND